MPCIKKKINKNNNGVKIKTEQLIIPLAFKNVISDVFFSNKTSLPTEI